MGNFKHWMSPLSNTWMAKRLQLAKTIVARETSLGMVPVLPGFSGHVPDALKAHYPNASVRALRWLDFNATYNYVGFLDPADPIFDKITQIYMQKVKEHFGTGFHAYNIDLFNEMAPPSYKKADVSRIIRGLYNSLTKADKDAVWVMQGWLFVNSASWLAPEAAQALLNTVPTGRMLLLDLYSEQIPVYNKTKSFYGQPFVWNMLHNFGGVSGLRGDRVSVNEGYGGAFFENSTIVGAGLTMEGMFQNYIMYQLMLDRAWSSAPLDLDQWMLSYLQQRYGMPILNKNLQDAWSQVWNGIYSCKGCQGNPEDLVITTPSLTIGLSNSATDLVKICRSWYTFLAASNTTALDSNYDFALDSVDVARELLTRTIGDLYKSLIKAYNQSNATEFEKLSTVFLDTFTDLEDLLASHPSFRLSTWLDQAKADATSPDETHNFVFNMKNQVTVWGPANPAKIEQIMDYAAKQWSGMVQNYYRKRWKLFLYQVLYMMQVKKPFDKAAQSAFDKMMIQKVELVFQNTSYPENPTNDPVGSAKFAMKKYIGIARKYAVRGKIGNPNDRNYWSRKWQMAKGMTV